MVLRVVGWLLMIEAFFMLAPLLVALIYREEWIAIHFGIAVVVTFLAGLFMNYRIKPKSKAMRKREGLLLTATVWVFFSLFGMIPFLLSGTVSGFTDGFFETMSGFTTTGASVIIDVEELPRGILFWRSMMQWILALDDAVDRGHGNHSLHPSSTTNAQLQGRSVAFQQRGDGYHTRENASSREPNSQELVDDIHSVHGSTCFIARIWT